MGRSLGDPGWKPTVRVGEAAMREVAAYLLDKDGFAKVPTSVLVRARHPIFCYNNAMGSARMSHFDLSKAASEIAKGTAMPMKLGSLQEFVPHECDTTEMGAGKFSVKDVHRIGILVRSSFLYLGWAPRRVFSNSISELDISLTLLLLRTSGCSTPTGTPATCSSAPARTAPPLRPTWWRG